MSGFEDWAKGKFGFAPPPRRPAPQDGDALLAQAVLALTACLTELTEAATEFAKQGVLGGHVEEGFIDEELQRVSQVCQQVSFDAEKMNPKWNKVYGKGNTHWLGPLSDGRSRGGRPYFCPDGWVRFALNLCPDSEFEAKFKDYAFAYHGTAGKNVGPILASGFMGAAYAQGDVYMSPSIEYCSHPRYAKPTWNPEIRKYVQCVLQCRVRYGKVGTVQPETLCHGAFNLTHHKHKQIDKNFSNSELEWLFKTEIQGPGQRYYVKDAIVCTGIMLRLTDKDPNDCSFWWSGSQPKNALTVVPNQVCDKSLWPCQQIKVLKPCTKNLDVTTMLARGGLNIQFDTVYEGSAHIAPSPFGEGGMRVASYAKWGDKYYVVKRFNKEVDQVMQDLCMNTREGVEKDIRCQVLAGALSKKFNSALRRAISNFTYDIEYVEPLLIQIAGREYAYAEEMMQGEFEKYNSNNGWINPDKSATGYLAAAFCHWSLEETAREAMVCDIQGCNIVWTDPQIHTKRVSHHDELFKRFGFGNHGLAGMLRFSQTHKCNGVCKALGLSTLTRETLKASVGRA